jgi:RND superfamily putative drug exporter
MTRVREEARRLGTRQGAVIALGATGGVITSAGACSPGLLFDQIVGAGMMI